MGNYRGKKQCASCGMEAKHRFWADANRAICCVCDKELRVGREAIKAAESGSECATLIRAAKYTPGPYHFWLQHSFGVDTSGLSNRTRTAQPPYVTDDFAYSSKALCAAINDFLKALEDGAPIKAEGSIYCDDGTHISKHFRIRQSHAFAWVKFYHEMSLFCEGLVKVGEARGRDYLQALLQKEVSLYQG